MKPIKERECDLIVMGTHGRTGVKHLLVGSIAEHIVRTAPCPVLTLRVPA
jgi:universal stress protein A